MTKQSLSEPAKQNQKDVKKFDDLFNQPMHEILQKIKENFEKIALIVDNILNHTGALSDEHKIALTAINTINDNSMNLICFLKIKNYINEAIYEKFTIYCQTIKCSTIKVFSSSVDFNHSQDSYSTIELISIDSFEIS